MLLKDLKNGLKVQTLIAQKDFLEKFKKEVRGILRDRISTKRETLELEETWDRSTGQCGETLNLLINGVRSIQNI